MPSYCFECEDGEIVELTMPWTELFRRRRKDGTVRLGDGRIARRCWGAEHAGFKDTPGAWPQTSNAMGCRPDEVDGMNRKMVEFGIDVRFNTRGAAEIASNQARNDLLRAEGKHDLDAAYRQR